MGKIRTFQRSLKTVAFVCCGLHWSGLARQTAASATAAFPAPETLSYRIEWRMVTAGQAKLQLQRASQGWQTQLNIQSAGLVSRLFRIEDVYKVASTEKFCGLNSSFEAQEGKRHVVESEQFDNVRHKGIFELHDLAKNMQERQEIDIAPCTYDILGALESLRQDKLEPGKSVTVPIINGKKMAYAKIEAQAKENLSLNGTSYSTMRYEAFIFDNVVFRRKGSLFIWVTDDSAHVPVQMRFQMGFPIGSINLELDSHPRR